MLYTAKKNSPNPRSSLQYQDMGETHKELADKDIVKKLQETSDRAYFERLYSRHAQKVFWRCMSYLRNKEDAEDATQEIWVKTYFALEKFEQKSLFTTWLYRITANHCVNCLKKRKEFISLDALKEEGFELKDKRKSTIEEATRKDEVTKALSRLSKHTKALLLMKYVDGYTYEEIAQKTSISPSAVKMRIMRAKEQMQKSAFTKVV
jgi:RNA polymerase sigma factor (sigma-70 family)